MKRLLLVGLAFLFVSLSMNATVITHARMLLIRSKPELQPNDLTQLQAKSGKPNIIFLLADDLDYASMQYMPKMKSLIADQGVTFENYFVSMSLCCPSRSTTLRGQYGHNTQILGNEPPMGGFQRFYELGEEKSTVSVWLQDSGYRTMLAGKYLNGFPDKSNPMYIPPGWSEWYSAVKGNAYGEFDYTLNENGRQVQYGHQPQDYGTDVYVGKAVDFIQRSVKDGKPFFVYLAVYAPHAPYTPAPRHANLFPDAKAPRTPNYNEADVSDKPSYIRNRQLLTERVMNVIDQDYRKRLQSLQAVDEGIENLVNTLKTAGQLDNTYFFFTSDNGYHMGNHRQIVGKVSPYDEELRVTMRVRGPGVPAGKTLEHLAVNTDLAPTFAELTGAKAADFVDGRSLVPLLRDNPPSLNMWRQAFSIENGPDKSVQNLTTYTPDITDPSLLEPQDQDESDRQSLPKGHPLRDPPPPARGVRFQTVSYVEYSTGEVELYDLQKDPYQLQNLIPKTNQQLLNQLSSRVKELMTCKASTCRTAEDTPFSSLSQLIQTSSISTQTVSQTTSSGTASQQLLSSNQLYIMTLAIIVASLVGVGIYARHRKANHLST